MSELIIGIGIAAAFLLGLAARDIIDPPDWPPHPVMPTTWTRRDP